MIKIKIRVVKDILINHSMTSDNTTIIRTTSKEWISRVKSNTTNS